jgi:hypothetical protein
VKLLAFFNQAGIERVWRLPYFVRILSIIHGYLPDVLRIEYVNTITIWPSEEYNMHLAYVRHRSVAAASLGPGYLESGWKLRL